MGKQLNIFKEKAVEKGRGKAKTTATESVFCKFVYIFIETFISFIWPL